VVHSDNGSTAPTRSLLMLGEEEAVAALSESARRAPGNALVDWASSTGSMIPSPKTPHLS